MGERYLEDFVTHMSHPVCWPLPGAALCRHPTWSPWHHAREGGLWAGVGDAHAGGAPVGHLQLPPVIVDSSVQPIAPPGGHVPHGPHARRGRVSECRRRLVLGTRGGTACHQER